MPLWTLRGTAVTSYLAASGGSNCNVATRCVQVSYPEEYWHPVWRRYYAPPTFHGTLLTDKADHTGQLFRRNRYYDPATGRFTQEDPIGLAGGINAYGFANGDPVSYSDPFGLCPFTGSSEDCLQLLANWGARNGSSGVVTAAAAGAAFGAALEATFGGGGCDGMTIGGHQVACGGAPTVGPAAIESELVGIERSFGNIATELKTSNHFRAARLERTGRLNTGFDHGNELGDFANGLRNYSVRLKKMLGNGSLDTAARQRIQGLLSDVSNLRDQIMEVLR